MALLRSGRTCGYTRSARIHGFSINPSTDGERRIEPGFFLLFTENSVNERKAHRQPDLVDLPASEQRHRAVEILTRESQKLLIQICGDVSEFARIQSHLAFHRIGRTADHPALIEFRERHYGV